MTSQKLIKLLGGTEKGQQARRGELSFVLTSGGIERVLPNKGNYPFKRLVEDARYLLEGVYNRTERNTSNSTVLDPGPWGSVAIQALIEAGLIQYRGGTLVRPLQIIDLYVKRTISQE